MSRPPRADSLRNLARYVESGRLNIVLPQYALPSADLFVYYLSRRNLAARTRVFIDFLVEHFRVSHTVALLPARSMNAED